MTKMITQRPHFFKFSV